ncbi:MAG: hypothetical protein ACE5KY_03210 [Candidatus Tectimicrobiota bacterium]
MLDHDVEHEESLTSFALPDGRRIEVAVIEMGIETRDHELMEAVKRGL